MTTSISKPVEPVIVFDGVCNFCNAAINFVIDHDHDHRFRFAALQSDAGQQLTARYAEQPISPNSIVLIDEDRVYYKSDAVLHILKHLDGWRWLYGGQWIPAWIRNTLYDFVARHRYLILGKRAGCRVPTEQEKKLFLT